MLDTILQWAGLDKLIYAEIRRVVPCQGTR